MHSFFTLYILRWKNINRQAVLLTREINLYRMKYAFQYITDTQTLNLYDTCSWLKYGINNDSI